MRLHNSGALASYKTKVLAQQSKKPPDIKGKAQARPSSYLGTHPHPLSDRSSSIRNRQLSLRPLATIQRPCERRNIIALGLIKHIEAIPQRPIASLLRIRSAREMRAGETFGGASGISNRERLFLEERRVLSLVRHVVALDAAVRHLRVKVSRVAERCDWVDAADG